MGFSFTTHETSLEDQTLVVSHVRGLHLTQSFTVVEIVPVYIKIPFAVGNLSVYQLCYCVFICCLSNLVVYMWISFRGITSQRLVT